MQLVSRAADREPELSLEPVPRRARVVSPDIAFALFCALVAIARLGILLHPAAPAGIDSGNWLALGRDLLGTHIRSRSIVYPPVVPLLVTAAVNLFGLVHGVALVAVVSSLLPAAGTYFVLRRTGLDWRAGLLAGLLATASATGEASAWGGFPQLVALGLLPILLWALDRFLRGGRWRQAVGAGCILALILATSHLVALLAIASAGVLVSLHLLLLRREDRQKGAATILVRGLLILVPSLPLVPLYRSLMAGIVGQTGSRNSLLLLTPANLLTNLDFLFRDFAVFWRIALTIACVTPLVLIHRRRTTQWMLATSLLTGSAAVAAVTRQPRYLYGLPIAAVLSLAVWASELDEPASPIRHVRGGMEWLLVAAFTAQAVLGLNFFRLQRDYYGVLSPQTTAGLLWLGTNTPPSATVAVTTARNDHMLGWWVEGVSRRRTLSSSALIWLNFHDEVVQAQKAEALFSEDFPSAHTMDLARRDGVQYLLVAKTWPGYPGADMASFRAQAPETFVYENPSVVILRVPAPAAAEPPVPSQDPG